MITAVTSVGTVVVLLGVVTAAFGLVLGFRRSVGAQRRRWVTYGAATATVGLAALVASEIPELDVLQRVAVAIVVCALAVSVALAVSRYRRYDLDRVISRSLPFLLLTAMVAAVYVVVVVLLGALGGSTRVNAGVAAVAAALAVAPLRSAAQRWVDRSLFGRRTEPFAVVSALNRRLRAATSPDLALDELARAMATDLRLPSVAVVSAAGTVLAEHRRADGGGTIDWPLVQGHRAIGTLRLGLRRGEDSFDAREVALIDDLAGRTAAAVEAVVLVDDLRASQRRLVTAREEERRRLRADLHDGLGPQLAAVTLKLDAARNLSSSDPDGADQLLRGIRSDVRGAIEDIRRVVRELRPPGLDELGLVGAIRRYAATAAPAVAGPEIIVEAGDAVDLPAPVEVAAYRIATEAIANAVRHAGARRCRVRVVVGGDLTIDVRDDGVGIPRHGTAGAGITSMRERTDQLGGTLLVEGLPGDGTTVHAVLPLDGFGIDDEDPDP